MQTFHVANILKHYINRYHPARRLVTNFSLYIIPYSYALWPCYVAHFVFSSTCFIPLVFLHFYSLCVTKRLCFLCVCRSPLVISSFLILYNSYLHFNIFQLATIYWHILATLARFQSFAMAWFVLSGIRQDATCILQLPPPVCLSIRFSIAVLLQARHKMCNLTQGDRCSVKRIVWHNKKKNRSPTTSPSGDKRRMP